jgi:hypothetical protein
MALNLGDFTMNVFTKQFFAAAGVITTLWVASASPLFAGVQDYEFQLVQNEAKKGDAIVAVRLVNKRTGKAVSDAVIAAKRIDMAPDGMADMAGALNNCRRPNPASIASRRTCRCKAVGSFHWPPRCRAKTARLKANSSSRSCRETPWAGRC